MCNENLTVNTCKRIIRARLDAQWENHLFLSELKIFRLSYNPVLTRKSLDCLKRFDFYTDLWHWYTQRICKLVNAPDRTHLFIWAFCFFSMTTVGFCYPTTFMFTPLFKQCLKAMNSCRKPNRSIH